jgi:signal transduction histidine kinase
LVQAGLKEEERNKLRVHYLEKHLSLAQKQNNKREEAHAFNSLADYYEEIADFRMALDFRKKYVDVYTQVVNEESNKNMSGLRMRYEAEKKEQEITLLKKEGEQKLLDERVRLSRELHDDIGSTLGSLAVYSDVAKNRSVKNENPVEVLSKIGDASRDLIERMSDIVWSLNPHNEPFEQLQHRMQSFAAMTLTPGNIAVDFNVDGGLKSVILTGEQRKNIFLIYKEAVYNIMKYAECSNVAVDLIRSDGYLKLSIRDDGKGFNAENTSAYNGNGIKNMKARAEDMKAMFYINSKAEHGATVELKLTI